MIPLDNDPDNPCAGCGPNNPRGLRLRFLRDGDVVRSTLRAEPHFQGSPGRLHSGILYLAMLEVANWTVYGLRDRVGVPIRTSALETRSWLPVGMELRIEGHLRPVEKPDASVAVEARDAGGKAVATLTRDFAFMDEETFVQRMGYPHVPDVFEGAFPRRKGRGAGGK